jgi:hypothetical protein
VSAWRSSRGAELGTRVFGAIAPDAQILITETAQTARSRRMRRFRPRKLLKQRDRAGCAVVAPPIAIEHMFYSWTVGSTPFVWVRKEYAPVEHPGLVLEWRRDAAGGWQALVAWIDNKPPRVVTEWLAPARLRPVPPDGPRTGSMYG